jgi:hypothetical protein
MSLLAWFPFLRLLSKLDQLEIIKHYFLLPHQRFATVALKTVVGAHRSSMFDNLVFGPTSFTRSISHRFSN